MKWQYYPWVSNSFFHLLSSSFHKIFSSSSSSFLLPPLNSFLLLPSTTTNTIDVFHHQFHHHNATTPPPLPSSSFSPTTGNWICWINVDERKLDLCVCSSFNFEFLGCSKSQFSISKFWVSLNHTRKYKHELWVLFRERNRKLCF